MKLHTKQLTLAALTAAAYAVLSYFGSIFGITYGPIQCRFSEALCVLPSSCRRRPGVWAWAA